jgi:hypothetical protein
MPITNPTKYCHILFLSVLWDGYIKVIHAYAKAGGAASARKAQELLETMQKMYQEGNPTAKPDTITVRPTCFNEVLFFFPVCVATAFSQSPIFNRYFGFSSTTW